MSSSNNEALVRRAVESIWNRGDLDLADELFAPDYVNHHGLIADVVRGPEAIKVSAALYRLAFPDLRQRFLRSAGWQRRCAGTKVADGSDAQPLRRWKDHRELDRMGSDRRARWAGTSADPGYGL